jgi:hypothetical protein
VPARPPTPGFPPQTSRRAVSLAETRESAARNPDFEGSSTADQIARRSLVAACTLSRHADTYGRQGFQVGTVVLCLCAVGWGRGCAGGRPASSLRTAPDLSFPMIDRCIDLQQSFRCRQVVVGTLALFPVFVFCLTHSYVLLPLLPQVKHALRYPKAETDP